MGHTGRRRQRRIFVTSGAIIEEERTTVKSPCWDLNPIFCAF